jgi:hypothetical protein
MFSKCSLLRLALLFLPFFMMASLTGCGKPPQANQFVPNNSGTSNNVPATSLTILSLTGGNVLVLKPGAGDYVRASEGMTLEADYKIRTDVGGQATVTFFEGSTISLKGETEIGLTELGFSGATTSIKLTQEIGQTISRVQKLTDPASRYEIQTKAAVAAVRGSTMYVAVAQDGTTVVGNIEGTIGVIAQGAEVSIPIGSHSNVVPGQPAGQPEAGPTPLPPTAKISLNQNSDRQLAYPGDTINYTYTVSNNGSAPLAGISLIASRGGQATYNSGDSNNNTLLDTGEAWIYSGKYATRVADDVGQLVNTATASGTAPDNQKATFSVAGAVSVREIIVLITNLQQGNIVTRTVGVSGTVNDPSITEATISVNSNAGTRISVINGAFSTNVNLVDGNNTITVSVTKEGGITKVALAELVPTNR